jgi:hypothetical protein
VKNAAQDTLLQENNKKYRAYVILTFSRGPRSHKYLCQANRPTHKHEMAHSLVQMPREPTSSAKTRDLLTLLMMQTAKVNRPAGEPASLLAASGHRRQLRRHWRHECSSSRARRSTGGGQRVCWLAWLSCTARSSSRSSVTPSKGSPINSWTKLPRKTVHFSGQPL